QSTANLTDEPLFKSLDIDPEDLQHLSAEPKLAGTVAALFNLYKNTRTQLEKLTAQKAGSGQPGAVPAQVSLDYSPFDEVSDFLEAKRNWFPELEEHAEALRRDFALDRQVTSHQLMKLISERFGYRVEFEPAPSGSSVVRRLDPETKTLTFSPPLPAHPPKFQPPPPHPPPPLHPPH